MGLGRVLRTGLSSLRDRAAARLAALRFNPSRKVYRLSPEEDAILRRAHLSSVKIVKRIERP